MGKLAFAVKNHASATELLAKAVLGHTKATKKLAFAFSTFTPKYALDDLLKMKEAEIVSIALSIGIDASVKDNKNSTIEKIIRKQKFF